MKKNDDVNNLILELQNKKEEIERKKNIEKIRNEFLKRGVEIPRACIEFNLDCKRLGKEGIENLLSEIDHKK